MEVVAIVLAVAVAGSCTFLLARGASNRRKSKQNTAQEQARGKEPRASDLD